MRVFVSVLVLASSLQAVSVPEDFTRPPRGNRPQTWFHLIGGNVSKAGLTADLEAIAQAGIQGIQLFHGQVGEASAWPRVKEQISCLSPQWDDMIGHAATECRRLGLKFEMQNCPGWSMSGGPWISPTNAMRRLVCFPENERPAFGADDDYRPICVLDVPRPAGFGEPEHAPVSVTTNGDARVFSFAVPVTVRSLLLPPPRGFNGAWAYEPDVTLVVERKEGETWRRVLERSYPRGCWQDREPTTFSVPETTAATWRVTLRHRKRMKDLGFVRFSPLARFDNWEALCGRCFRSLPDKDSCDIPLGDGTVRLEFGHVNFKSTNGPAPAEATGWECDKLDARGFRANFDAYVGRLLKGPLAGGKLQGILVDSWECGRQNWTWRLEEAFLSQNGYALRPFLPALFGYSVGKSPDETYRFLRDWRKTISRLAEENYYRVIGEIGRAHGLTVQFEAAFGDVIHGDFLRYWKYADIPMSEFWLPADNARGGVSNDDYKPVRPCVSAAHVYGKRRVQAEAFTSFALNWHEDFMLFKSAADRRFADGVTHLVFHTYTHNPQVDADFLPPGSCFGTDFIGSPFLRGQPWWRHMPRLTDYFARCGWMLERGHPVVDVLRYLGDDYGHRPHEREPFPEGLKADFCNFDVLSTRLTVKDGRLFLPDGLSYAVLWIPEGTYLDERTVRIFERLEGEGARIVRGSIDGVLPPDVRAPGLQWYHRHDGGEDVYFLAATAAGWHGRVDFRSGESLQVSLASFESVFVTVRNGKVTVLDPVTGDVRPDWKNAVCDGTAEVLRPDWRTDRAVAEDDLDGRYTAVMPGLQKPGPCLVACPADAPWREISVNGRPVETLWCEPFVADVGPYLHAGENVLEMRVTRPFANRLEREKDLPVEKRRAWTHFRSGQGPVDRVCTAELQARIDAAARAGGGTVTLAPGRYVTGQLELKSNVTLYLEPGAALIGSGRIEDFPLKRACRIPSQKDVNGWCALLYAAGATNVAVVGAGLIDGRGEISLARKGLDVYDLDGRPRNLLFDSCRGVTVRGVTLRNPGMWNQHYFNCEDVSVEDVKVFARVAHNNDGLDIDGCRRVTIRGCQIDSADDAVVLKSTGHVDCEDVLVEDCRLSSQATAFKIGTESVGDFRNVRVRNLSVFPSPVKTAFVHPLAYTNGISAIEIATVDGGTVEDVDIEGVDVHGVACAFYLRVGTRLRPVRMGDATGMPGRMRNIRIARLTADGLGDLGASATAFEPGRMTDVVLEDVALMTAGGVLPQSAAGQASYAPHWDGYPSPTASGPVPAKGLFTFNVPDLSVRDFYVRTALPDARPERIDR